MFPYWPCTVLVCAFLAYRAWKDTQARGVAMAEMRDWVVAASGKAQTEIDRLEREMTHLGQGLGARIGMLEDAKPLVTADDLAKLVARVNAITADAVELKEEHRKFKASMLLGGGPKKREGLGG